MRAFRQDQQLLRALRSKRYDELLDQLLAFGMVRLRPGTKHFDGDALVAFTDSIVAAMS